jgi:CRP/FNR family transcriptional regulator
MNPECKLCEIKSNAASKLSEEEIEKLSFSCALVKFHKGDPLIKQGTFSTNVAYLRKGLAKVHIAGPYHEQIVRIVKAPVYLALPTTFGDKINQYSVTVIEASEVCFIDIDMFRYLLKVNQDFSYEILLEVCRNELEVFHRCANRTQKMIRGKIADVLLEMSDRIFNSDIFSIPVNQEDIGNLVDSSRESVSRVLTEFDRDGIIRISGKKIEILNKKSLLMISANG